MSVDAIQLDSRLETAFRDPSPHDALRRLAIEFSRGGMDPSEVLAFFEHAARQLRAADRETEEDSVLEVLDDLVGYCSSHMRLEPWLAAKHDGSTTRPGAKVFRVAAANVAAESARPDLRLLLAEDGKGLVVRPASIDEGDLLYDSTTGGWVRNARVVVATRPDPADPGFFLCEVQDQFFPSDRQGNLLSTKPLFNGRTAPRDTNGPA